MSRSTGLKDLAHELDEWKKTVVDLSNQVDANQASHETFVTEKVGLDLRDLFLSQPANHGRSFSSIKSLEISPLFRVSVLQCF
jgi:hypothetical protein